MLNEGRLKKTSGGVRGAPHHALFFVGLHTMLCFFRSGFEAGEVSDSGQDASIPALLAARMHPQPGFESRQGISLVAWSSCLKAGVRA